MPADLRRVAHGAGRDLRFPAALRPAFHNPGRSLIPIAFAGLVCHARAVGAIWSFSLD